MAVAETSARPRLRTLDLAYTALFTVLMAVCAWISIPAPKPLVPFTLQTFAVFAALTVLGGRRGTYAVTAYLLLGAVGLPVFAGFRGGLEVLLGTTGGYILGFLLAALGYWLAERLLGRSFAVRAGSCVLVMAVYFTFGTVWFLQVYARTSGPMGVGAALAACVFPFILPDLIKAALALMLARRVEKYLK